MCILCRARMDTKLILLILKFDMLEIGRMFWFQIQVYITGIVFIIFQYIYSY